MNVQAPLFSGNSREGATSLCPPRVPTAAAEGLRQAARILAVFALTFVCYLAITHFLLQTVKVVGSSMAPTLRNSQLYFLNRFVFLIRDPRPGDIVVLRDPADHGFSVKRVIATPGDFVAIQDGKIFLNGRELREAYLPKGLPTYPLGTERAQSFACGPSQFLVLGDNRMNSADSRNYGPVPAAEILGLLVN